MYSKPLHLKPFFSIIIPSYNRADFLTATIRSVINQEYQNWECLVVDDGSTDNTKEVLSSYEDPRLKYFYKRNEERSIARNYGIEKACGKYICFLDSDDEYNPEHLQLLYDEIETKNFPKAVFSSGMYERREEKLIPRALYSEVEYEHPVLFIWEKFVLPTSVCIHHSILKVDKFPRQYNVWEDTHLWLRIAAKYPFYQLNEYTCQWNVHKGGTVEKAFNKVTASHVIEYLNCISHLQKNYKELLKPFLLDIGF